MRLLKLMAYALLGYVLYEFFRGLTSAEQAEAGIGGQGGSREMKRGVESDAGRMNMTGPARGAQVQTEEPGGTSVPHTVGRGVVGR